MSGSRTARAGVATALAAAVLVGTVACEEMSPTSIDETVLPGAPVTIEIEIPWEEFGSGLEVFGGFGRPAALGTGIVANAFAGTLDARTLVRFGAFPRSASVADTAGTTRTDTLLSIKGGRFVAYFNAPASTNDGPVTLSLATLQEAWHPATAGWANAVDTLGGATPWSAPGGGAVVEWGTAEWNRASGDSLVFALDSAQVAAWREDADARARGALLDLVTEGERLAVRAVALRLDAVPSINPDTVVQLAVPNDVLTFIYDPAAAPPAGIVRVGGVPAWRSVLDVAVPRELTGPPALCEALGCPVALEAGEVSYAAIVLTSRATEAAYQPTDSVRLDVRPVLAPEALPRSPLGSSLVGTALPAVAGGIFGPGGAGARVEVPITSFVRALLGEDAEEGAVGRTSTLALIAAGEPSSFSFAEFEPPGTAGAPVLKLIVTIGPSVGLP